VSSIEDLIELRHNNEQKHVGENSSQVEVLEYENWLGVETGNKS